MKRLFDLVVAAIALLCLSPAMAAVALVIALQDGRPVLFKQERVGRDGKLFRIYKFRTMHSSHGGPNISATGDSRVTRIGAHLRKCKADELPQLANVLRGDMSLVGPRPEVPEFVQYWPPSAKREILSVRPGITDPASIKFRDEAELLASVADPNKYYIHSILPAKASMYVEYVNSRSFLGDLKILFDTFRSI